MLDQVRTPPDSLDGDITADRNSGSDPATSSPGTRIGPPHGNRCASIAWRGETEPTA
jgi:hypothetical protein